MRAWIRGAFIAFSITFFIRHVYVLHGSTAKRVHAPYTKARIISASNPSQTMAAAATLAGGCRFERGVDYGRGSRENRTGVKSEQECCAFCANEPSCAVATYMVVQEWCWFKRQDALSRPPSAKEGAVSCVLNANTTEPVLAHASPVLVEEPPQPHLGNISRDLDLVHGYLTSLRDDSASACSFSAMAVHVRRVPGRVWQPGRGAGSIAEQYPANYSANSACYRKWLVTLYGANSSVWAPPSRLADAVRPVCDKARGRCVYQQLQHMCSGSGYHAECVDVPMTDFSVKSSCSSARWSPCPATAELGSFTKMVVRCDALLLRFRSNEISRSTGCGHTNIIPYKALDAVSTSLWHFF